MTIHREGYKTIAFAALALAGVNFIFAYFFRLYPPVIVWILIIVSVFVLLFIISFFRSPEAKLTISGQQIISPADGKVVVIEEIFDTEYFNAKRLQVSIFMSPANVHINRLPVSGEIVYSKYHKGKYLVAWNPKSSTENERHSIVVKNGDVNILVKQIAGAVAKRIINYMRVGDIVQQGSEMGFIKFGSRVDVLLPPDVQINVQLNQAVKGGVTVLATFAKI